MQSEKSLKITIAASITIITLVVVLLVLQYAPQDINAIRAYGLVILDYFKAHPVAGTSLFIGFYFLINALPLPLISIPTILAGYLFGTVNALIIVSFAGAFGASCLFLTSRYLLKNWVRNVIIPRYPLLKRFEKSDNFLNATSLRLLPGIPICIPSIALSVTNITFYRFYLSTQIGMLFILFVYVNAGNHLMDIKSINDIFSKGVILSMCLLALSPLISKFLIQQLQTAKS